MKFLKQLLTGNEANPRKMFLAVSASVTFLFFMGSFILSAFASPPTSPYLPGETLDPGCAPGATNCTVNAPLSATTTLSNGSLLFIGNASGTVSQNSTSLVWDNTNARLGIGTASPSSTLHVVGGATISGNATTTNLTISGIAGGSSQCLQIDTNGVVTGSGGACGNASLSGSGVANLITFWSASSTLTSNANFSWNSGSSTLQVVGTVSSTQLRTPSSTIGSLIVTGTSSLQTVTLTNATATGNVNAATFTGSGASLTGITASQVGLGSVTNALQLAAANNLSDLTNTSTARTNIGFTAGNKISISATGTIGLTSSAISQFTNDSGYLTSLSGALVAASNLSDLTNTSTARTNIGLGNLSNALQLVAANNLSDLVSTSTARTNIGLGSLSNALQLVAANNLSDLTSTSTARTNIGFTAGNKITISATGTIGLTSSAISQFTNDSGYLTSLSGALVAANNLSDLVNTSTARTNIGLGNIVNSLQLAAANNLSDLTNTSTARTNIGLGNLSNALQLVAANNLSDLTNTSTARTNIGFTAGSKIAISATGTIGLATTSISQFANDAGYLTVSSGTSAITLGGVTSSTFQVNSQLAVSSTGTIQFATTSISQFINDAGYLTTSTGSGALTFGGVTSSTFQVSSQLTVSATGTLRFATSSISQFTNDSGYITTSTGLTVANFASANISQFTNNSGYLTSLSGALVAASNLSDLTNTSTARTNIGLGNLSNALQLVAANNLSDLTSTSTARTNIGFTAGNKISISATGTIGLTSSAISQFTNDSGYITTSTGLTVANFASANISQFTNNSGYLTSLSGALVAANNLSDLVNTSTARTNIGYYDVASTWAGLQTFNGGGLFNTANGSTSTLQITGVPFMGTTSSLVLFGSNILSGGSVSGTFLGANPSGTFNGDFINFQVASTSRFVLNASGSLAIATGTQVANGLLNIATSTNIFAINGNGQVMIASTTAVASSLLTIGTSTNILTVLKNGNVGVGTTAPGSLLTVSKTFGTTASTNALSVTPTVLVTTTSSATYAGISQNITISTASSTTGTLDGILNSVNYSNTNPATLASLYGINNSVTSLGTVGTAYGVFSNIQGAIATISTAYGIYSNISNSGGSGTITTGYGLFVDDLAFNAPGSNLYALYTSGVTKSYFGGRVGIGANSTTSMAQLTVGGLPTQSATSSLVLLGSNWLSGGNASGTFLAANPTSPFNGDFINFQVGSTTQFRVASSGKVTALGGFNGQCLSSETFASSSASSCNMDVAESYPTFEPTVVGDIVAIPSAGSHDVDADSSIVKIGRARGIAGERVLGVVSMNPGLIFDNGITRLAGANDHLITPSKTVVALAGRVPVKISLQNGPITAGDELALSVNLPGVAVRAIQPGNVIGVALQDYDANTPSSSFMMDASGTTPEILVFINPHWSLGNLIRESDITSSSWATDSMGTGLLDQFTLYVKYAFQKLGVTISNGILSVKEFVAGKVTTKQLCLDDVCIDKEQLRTIINQTGAGSSQNNAASGGSNTNNSNGSGTTTEQNSAPAGSNVTSSVEEHDAPTDSSTTTTSGTTDSSQGPASPDSSDGEAGGI